MENTYLDVMLDKEQIENSEYIYNDIGQKYNKTFNEITEQGKNEINEDVFIPDF